MGKWPPPKPWKTKSPKLPKSKLPPLWVEREAFEDLPDKGYPRPRGIGTVRLGRRYRFQPHAYGIVRH